VGLVDQFQRPAAPRVRLSVATALGVTSIGVSILLISADGIGRSVQWSHHAAVSAAPLLLVAGAIAAVSVAHPAKARHGLMRLVAVLAFSAWGMAQLFPNSAAAGTLNDVAILLFVVDAGIAVISDSRTIRRAHRPPSAPAAARLPVLGDTWDEVQHSSQSPD
jgi:hypothetical protein